MCFLVRMGSAVGCRMRKSRRMGRASACGSYGVGAKASYNVLLEYFIFQGVFSASFCTSPSLTHPAVKRHCESLCCSLLSSSPQLRRLRLSSVALRALRCCVLGALRMLSTVSILLSTPAKRHHHTCIRWLGVMRSTSRCSRQISPSLRHALLAGTRRM